MATVLIADDNADTRLLVTTLLRHAGHKAIEATNGMEAMERTAEHRPNLVILDLSMPEMSGAEFIRSLRANPQTKRTVVALYTATAMSPALADFMEIYGIEHLIRKPCEPSEFLSSVRLALSS